ncbi:TonB-dependent receptor [Oceanibaculum indicum]|uniref:Iron complex outermembrane receptor protein n=1 Tax=Oceanibaculum indicum TaxID=526216 RepID=A0A420WR44_9PROT|nr:TonB-dependent siderophore receptor [Oceanibaculum indicum]RKQ73518.1 iron complex outermembrane receptor protein [Oceanibaculum indicum]
MIGVTETAGRGCGRAAMLGMLLATTALVAGAVPVKAQQAGSGGAVQLSPVVVEGEGGNAKSDIGTPPPAYAGGQVSRGARVGALGNRDIMDVPFSVISYTEELIQNQQAETLADVLENDPGVRSTYGFGNFAELFVIRGFPVNGEDITVDGLAGMAPRQVSAVESLGQVEVLRGSNAFLNGIGLSSSGIGGGINLVPKRAGDEPLTRLTFGWEQESRIGAHLDIGRRYGDNKEFGVRANVALRDGETAIENEQRDAMLGALALDYRGERLRATLDLSNQRLRVDQGRPTVRLNGTSVPGAPDSDINYGQPYAYSEMRETTAQTRVEYDFTDNLMGYAAVGVRDTREDGEFASLTVNGNGDGTVGRMYVPREDFTTSGIAGLRGEAVTGMVAHRLDGGVSGAHTENRNSFDFAASNPTSIYNPVDYSRPDAYLFSGSQTDLPKVSETELRSVFFSDTLSVYDDRVQLTLGARHQWLQVENFDRSSGARTSNYDESETSPVVGIVVKPLDYLSLYANRIEGLSQGDSAPSTAVNVGEVLPPYVSTQYEVGAKLDFGRVGASVAVFQIEKPNAVLDPATQYYGVSGEQENRGIELMLFGEPMKGLRLLGGLTFIEAELNGTAGGANDGNTAVGVPEFLANAGVEWDTPFLRGLTLSGRVIHTGSQYVNDANTLEIPDWTRLDIGARYATMIREQPVVFRANIENVTDEAYWSSAQGGYLVQGRPLTAKFSVAVDF